MDKKPKTADSSCAITSNPLLDCPFCGSGPELQCNEGFTDQHGAELWTVRCMHCNSHGPYAMSAESSERDWNTREEIKKCAQVCSDYAASGHNVYSRNVAHACERRILAMCQSNPVVSGRAAHNAT